MAVVITMSHAELEISKRIQKEVANLAESLSSVVQAAVNGTPRGVVVNAKEEPATDKKGPGLGK